MSDLLELSVYSYIDILASKAAVPGGGGASAVVGALAASLGHMVGALTTGKKKYADVEEDIQALMTRAEDLSRKFCEAANEDAEAFEPLSRAYGLPKDAEGRDGIMEKCLRDAAAAPLKILGLCLESAEVLKEFAEKGSKLVVSDAATGAAFTEAAAKGAAINVKVNTKLMKDRAYAEAVDSDVDSKLRGVLKITSCILNDYYGGF